MGSIARNLIIIIEIAGYREVCYCCLIVFSYMRFVRVGFLLALIAVAILLYTSTVFFIRINYVFILQVCISDFPFDGIGLPSIRSGNFHQVHEIEMYSIHLSIYISYDMCSIYYIGVHSTYFPQAVLEVAREDRWRLPEVLFIHIYLYII